MTVTAALYGAALSHAFNGDIDWLNDTIKAALTGSGYSPAQDTHDYFSDVTSEVVGSGYTAGGKVLTGKTLTYTAASNLLVLDAADVVWDPSTLSGVRRVVLYKDTGSAATSPLIGWADLGEDMSSSNGPLTVAWAAGGIVAVTVGALA